ncbi:MAG: hypothetical protein IJP29_05990 [Lachnospiraceae bacterium]|nr:hypothetical protein [Lachnospiraceae bacterium]
MKTIKKVFIVFVTVLCVGFIFSDVTTVEAAKKPKARVTKVTAKVSGKKNIKITFKKDKKAKKYGIKKYKIKLTQYNYVEKTNKWKKGKVTYKTVSAYNGKKLKNTVSVTVKNKKVSNSVAYKVQVASANNNGVTKTSYTTSKEIGCFHEWFTTTTKKKVTEETYVYDDEMKCSACGFTGTDDEVGAHMDAYRAKLEECEPLIAEAYANKYNCTVEDFYYEYNNTYDWESQVGRFILDWMAENTEFTGCTKNGYFGGCIYSTNTGNKIKVKVEDATYKNMEVEKCAKCGKEK